MKRKHLLAILLAGAMVGILLCNSAFALEAGSATDEYAALKESYYAEYLKIAEDVSEKTNVDIEVAPVEDFDKNGWKTPEEYRAYLSDFIAHWDPVITASGLSNSARGSTIVTKQATVSPQSGRTYTINVTGSFITILHSNSQIFGGLYSITSSAATSSGSSVTWTQTDYSAQIIDAGETCAITVNGTLRDTGATFRNLLISLEFYCSATGVVY